MKKKGFDLLAICLFTIIMCTVLTQTIIICPAAYAQFMPLPPPIFVLHSPKTAPVVILQATGMGPWVVSGAKLYTMSGAPKDLILTRVVPMREGEALLIFQMTKADLILEVSKKYEPLGVSLNVTTWDPYQSTPVVIGYYILYPCYD